eukprot:CAMPEP_0204357400 /NCGR_PEP_ID=MMETSP0469-20131031/35707_1 /ASSEMBLY_ACC=CAM_ASM_000384 /TAXON_ID=2969 /ORGANISM="Oxyrrhis marina" /LENGTH=34 /DNA_ID= /DNA_START= /DNA_END= /DNA_ORIENTATION=
MPVGRRTTRRGRLLAAWATAPRATGAGLTLNKCR